MEKIEIKEKDRQVDQKIYIKTVTFPETKNKPTYISLRQWKKIKHQTLAASIRTKASKKGSNFLTLH